MTNANNNGEKRAVQATKIALSRRGRIAAGAVAASLAVAVAVPAFAAGDPASPEVSFVGAIKEEKTGILYYPSDQMTVQIKVPQGELLKRAVLTLDGGDPLTIEEVDGQTWRDITPAGTDPAQGKVYEATVRADQDFSAKSVSAFIETQYEDKPNSFHQVSPQDFAVVAVDTADPAVSIKMSDTLAGQDANKVDYYGQSDGFDGLTAEVTVADASFDAETTTINGKTDAEDDSWAWADKGNGTYVAEVPADEIEDVEVDAKDKAAHATGFEYGQAGTTDASGAAVDGESFRVDDSTPTYEVWFNGIGCSDKDCFNTDAVEVQVKFRDAAEYDGGEIRVNGEVSEGWVESTETRPTASGEDLVLHVFTKTFTDEGAYKFEATTKAAWGEYAQTGTQALTIDRTSPQAKVEISGELKDEFEGVSYYGEKRTATITVEDPNFIPSDLAVSVNDQDAKSQVSWSKDGDVYTGTLEFKENGLPDGQYGLKLSGQDKAGNPVVFGQAEDGSDVTEYTSGRFCVDTVAPTIKIDPDPKDPEPKNGKYYSVKKRVFTVTVSDDGFDPSKAYITSTGSATSWTKINDSTYRAEVTFSEEGAHGIRVDVTDRTGHKASAGRDSFVIDRTAPEIGITFGDSEAHHGKYYQDFRTATVTVNEANFDPESSSIETTGLVVRPAGAESDWAKKEDGVYEASVVFDQEGDHTLYVQSTDLAGSASERAADPFVVDKVAPQAHVEWDVKDEDAKNGRYYDADRTATITVDERNFDPALIAVDTTGQIQTWTDDAGEAHEWKDEGTVHTLEVKFTDEEAEQHLNVSGTDLADRALEFDGDPSRHSYESGDFVIDKTDPVVGITFDRAPANTFAGIEYYDDVVTATVTVQDRNFDARERDDAGNPLSCLTTAGAQSETAWEQGATDAYGVTTWTKTVVFPEGADKVISAHVADLAERGADAARGAFTVDLTAPEVTGASVSTEPSNSYSTSYYFYNRPVSVSVDLSDNLGLESIKVVDNGDGYYGADVLVSGNSIVGATTQTATLSFADGHEFDRDVIIQTVDLAHNYRYWSIAPTGEVRAVNPADLDNLSVFDPQKIYPEALLRDTVAPQLTLSGAAEGEYYNAPQTVSLAVDELNFPYLQTFEPDQGVFTVTKQEGNAGLAQSTWTRPVSYLGITGAEALSFMDEHGDRKTYNSYGMSETFSEDGHYVIDAQVTDPARNQGTARLGEFTIDQTAPTVDVQFDNNDVRNGKYYKAARTATITVVEHNFDASLVDIQTNGSVSGWSDNGDTHTATVSFAADGVYNLAVSGQDKAGNAMTPYTAEEFVVDLTAPTVTITGVEDAHAYNGEVMPIISFADEANFDPAGTTYTVTGSKNGQVEYEAGASEDGLGSTVSFTDFAHDPGVDDIYTLEAHLTDLAGNEAEATLTFSVNRFGSNFRVVDADSYEQNNGYLTSRRDVVVEEINVSGVASEEHGVTVTQGMSVSELERTEGAQESGYSIEEATSESDDSRGWAVYTYRVAAGNFNKDGRYHVSVHSNDLAENINSSSDYFDRAQGKESAAEVDFILDTTDPVITNLSVKPGDVFEANDYEGSFTVAENIGIQEVKVYVDGQEAMAKGDAYGNYTFHVSQASFTPRELSIVATDLAGRTGEADVSGFRVTTNILELHLAWVIAGITAAAAAVAGIIFVLVKRKKEEEGID